MHPDHPYPGRHGRPSRRGHDALPPDLRGGGRRERLFESGHIRLLVLHLLDQQPRHGYDLIRAIAEKAGGDYSPSPGTVYPTLTMLEDMGQAVSETLADGRRQYRLTAAGQEALASQAEALQHLLQRLEHGRDHARARGVPEIRRAMENLKTALRLRFDGELPDPATAGKLAAIIDRAAVEIGRA